MRAAGLIFLLGLCGLLPARDAAASDPSAGGAKVHKAFNDLYDVAFRVKVNESIDRGVRWLLQSQRKDGSWSFFTHHRSYAMGSTALATLTLLKCGVKRDHPAIGKAFAYLRPLKMQAVYSVAVLAMALDAKYAPARDPFAIEHVDRYGHRGSKDPCANLITPEDREWLQACTDYLLNQQKADGYWRYPTGGYDTSNTQFALLGLHAATRCGVKISNRVWLDALDFMLGFQNKTGEAVAYKANEVRGRYRFEWTERAIARGFRYTFDSGRATGSMTAAGLACLVICQNRLWRSRGFDGKRRADTRRAVRDAMAWLQHNFAVNRNPHGHHHWTFYYLYGLERAGVLGRFRFLGTHDWYKQGAEFLFKRQDKAGYWHTDKHWEGSCFALLFLKRATSRMNAPVITPSGSKEGEMPATKEGPAPRTEVYPNPKTPTERAVFVAQAIRDLEDRDPDVVFLATVKLGHLRHLRAVQPLIKVLKLHQDNDARVGAANALGKLLATDAFLALIGALTDADELVRYAAMNSMVLIARHHLKTRLHHCKTRNDRVRLQKEWRAWWDANEAAVRGRLKQPQKK